VQAPGGTDERVAPSLTVSSIAGPLDRAAFVHLGRRIRLIRLSRVDLGPRIACLLLLWPAVGIAVEARSAEDRKDATLADAERVIEALDGRFLEVMKRAEELGYAGRCEQISPVVHQSFDVVFMARAVVGRAWKDLSKEEKDRWVATFEAFLISTFAHRFDGYSGQTFEVLGRKPASQNTVVVMTKLTRPHDEDVRLDYRMRERSDGWKIVDIYANGKVSEVATRHAEAASLLKDGGIENLIASTTEATERQASE
jgi:phospholipid transport system substrate-binding protein